MHTPTVPLLLALALLGVVASAPSCTQRGGDGGDGDQATAADEEGEAGEDAEPEAKEPLLVRVEPVVVGDVAKKLEATANVQSLEVVDVMPERAEPVVAILAEEGDRVAEGAVLARLRDAHARLALREAEVRVEETKRAMEQAERDYRRNLRMWEEGGDSPTLVAEQVVETSKQAWDAARTAHDSAIVARDRAELELEQCTLRAPIAGTVTARDLSEGDMATVGQRAFQITDLAAPKVIFHRPQRELTDLEVGQRLTATSEALPGVVLEGRIERVAPVVDQSSGTIKVTAALDPGDLVVPTGILVRVVLVLDRHEDALLVPKKALLYDGSRVSVFVARDGVAHRVEIHRGFEDPEYLEAAPETDLTADDVVVVVGADRLSEGDPVEIADE